MERGGSSHLRGEEDGAPRPWVAVAAAFSTGLCPSCRPHTSAQHISPPERASVNDLALARVSADDTDDGSSDDDIVQCLWDFYWVPDAAGGAFCALTYFRFVTTPEEVLLANSLNRCGRLSRKGAVD